jgi:hypothetical protein
MRELGLGESEEDETDESKASEALHRWSPG